MSMRKKVIAALVLASLAVWSVPVSFASAKRSAPLNYNGRQPSPAAAQHHSCCPGFHSPFVEQLFAELAPVPEMPCGDQHPCCARQVPENPPALTAASRVERPGSQSDFVSVTNPNASRGGAIAVETSGFFPPHFARSIVLRI